MEKTVVEDRRAGLEILLAMGAAHEEFAQALLKDRSRAAAAADVTLTANERRLLEAVEGRGLQAMIAGVDQRLAAPDRRRFLGHAMAACATLLGAGALAGCHKQPPSKGTDSPMQPDTATAPPDMGRATSPMAGPAPRARPAPPGKPCTGEPMTFQYDSREYAFGTGIRPARVEPPPAAATIVVKKLSTTSAWGKKHLPAIVKAGLPGLVKALSVPKRAKHLCACELRLDIVLKKERYGKLEKMHGPFTKKAVFWVLEGVGNSVATWRPAKPPPEDVRYTVTLKVTPLP